MLLSLSRNEYYRRKKLSRTAIISLSHRQRVEFLAPYLLHLLREAGMTVPENMNDTPRGSDVELHSPLSKSTPRDVEDTVMDAPPDTHSRTSIANLVSTCGNESGI